MRLSSIAITAAIFAAAGGLSYVSAHLSVAQIEAHTRTTLQQTFRTEGLTWAEIDTDGLQVHLFGTAPDEATRFAALASAGRVVDTARLIDQMLIADSTADEAPDFSVDILRNEAGLSVIGLIPTVTDRNALIARLTKAAGDAAAGGMVTDLLESADFPAPAGWDSALRFATQALDDLPRSQISVTPERVTIKAIAESEQARRALEAELERQVPEGLELALDVTAPRPVISPFVLRFALDDTGARMPACSADTEAARDRILRAAEAVGLEGDAECPLGLGVPTSDWSDAAVAGIQAVGALGGGQVAISNADIRLVAPQGTPRDKFDRAVGVLESGLPEIFVLQTDLPEPPEALNEGPVAAPDFVATRSPEGAVQLRGRLADARARQTVESFAKAQFGSTSVHMAAREDESVPEDWSVRALAAIEALAMLSNGSATVTPDSVSVSGRTGRPEASTDIAALLADKLGDGTELEIEVTYVEQLDPARGLPSPEECQSLIGEIIGDRKITFEPGSARLDASAEDILDELAELLKQCGDIPLEIAGHTDSQGREEMNQELSRDRAQSVRDGLRERLVPVRAYTAVGYGETRPIADNDTEEGREANRRIEFTLIPSDAIADEAETEEQSERALDAEPSADEKPTQDESAGAEGAEDE
ncbi:OmpA family protein [Citreimonas salinaria]|uniref:OmpA-OmpF porin, OOP family n=1 Tax=Citreimonas salinaria TaxID=321339 RepID=A0A1H3M9P0_9RHOB|nr:OmpA family protein [Citreimonas salinaria]SDY72994.1 OmpA-OmpF porin, OOP family [Citreimonas salinaria]